MEKLVACKQSIFIADFLSDRNKTSLATAAVNYVGGKFSTDHAFRVLRRKRVKISLLYRKCRLAVVTNGNHTSCVVMCRVWKPRSRFREFPGICDFVHFRVFRTKFPGIPGWYHYVTNLKILYEIFHFVLRKQKFV